MSARRRHALSDAEMAAALVDARNVPRWKERLSRCTFLSPTGCLISGRYSNAYTTFAVCVGDRRVVVGAHRYALMVKLGRPLREQALHSCDRPGCLSEDHLREGTQIENVRDAVRKRRLRGRLALPAQLRGYPHGEPIRAVG